MKQEMRVNLYSSVYNGSGYSSWTKTYCATYKSMKRFIETELERGLVHIKLEFVVYGTNFEEVVIGERILTDIGQYIQFKTELAFCKNTLMSTFNIPLLKEEVVDEILEEDDD